MTGSHRSGTTWIGRIIATAPGLFYIHEPFNVTDPPGPGICSAKFDYWFTYINQDNENKYYPSFKRLVSVDYNLALAIFSVRSIKEISKIIQERREFRFYKQNKFQPVIKDPLAFFSAEWLQANFNFSVVIVIRHPAAFVNSLIELGWHHPFSHFITQTALMKKHLNEYACVIREYSETKHNIIDQGILLWNIIYGTTLKFRISHQNWFFIKHEDFSNNPIQEFQNLFSQLNLDYNEHVNSRIIASSTSGKSNISDPFNINLNSRENVKKWKSRLTENQIYKIRMGVEHISNHFYSDKDW